jgi:hypothetical protein
MYSPALTARFTRGMGASSVLLTLFIIPVNQMLSKTNTCEMCLIL